MKKKIIIGVVNLILLSGCSGMKADLGIHKGKLTECPKTPNCVNSQAVDGEHAIEPIQYAGVRQDVRDRLLQILEAEKRAKIIINQDDYMRVEFASSLFGFVDDVEFYFLEKQAGETVIHIRSASRVGYSDFGVNRKRVEQIRSRLNK